MSTVALYRHDDVVRGLDPDRETICVQSRPLARFPSPSRANPYASRSPPNAQSNHQLASGLINGHDRLSVELVQPPDMRGGILLHWP
jgi:hypothetical protein